MLFCPKCGSMLQPKTEKGKKIMACSCGYSDKSGEELVVKEIVKEKKKVEVVEEDDEKLPLATDAICPKCGHKEIGYWLVQTRAGDEPETKFLKCLKCKYTWRDYS